MISFVFNCITIGFLICMGVYHLLIASERKDEKVYSYLSYGLFSLIPSILLSIFIYNDFGLFSIIISKYFPVFAVSFGFLARISHQI